jgi:tetratricopeptide (TPR) repeat protein
MKRVIWVGGGLALLAIGGIFMQRAPRAPDPANIEEMSGEPAPDREMIREFWEHLRAAGASRVAGEIDKAIYHYQEALKLDSLHEDALYYLSGMYMESGLWQAADSTLARLLGHHARSSRGHSRRGDLHFCYPEHAVYDLERAREAYGRAGSLNAEETGPLMRRAQVDLVARDYQAAFTQFTAVLASNQTSLESLLLGAYAARVLGNVAMARDFLSRSSVLIRGMLEADPVVGEGDVKTPSEENRDPSECPGMNRVIDSARRLIEQGASESEVFSALERQLKAYMRQEER